MRPALERERVTIRIPTTNPSKTRQETPQNNTTSVSLIESTPGRATGAERLGELGSTDGTVVAMLVEPGAGDELGATSLTLLFVTCTC